MKKVALSVLGLGLGFLLHAQDMNNLVENPGFEQTVGKIKKAGCIDVAVGWISPTGAPADLFAEKYAKTGFGTPSNDLGVEEPHGGKNYAGFRAFSYGDKEPRNYISSKLKMPLKKGMKYCVKFYVSLAEGSKYAANNIGVNFSKKQYNIDEDRSIISETHLAHLNNPAFNGYHGWDEVCGVYTAEGGEKFITIGNFTANGETTNERMKKPKSFMGSVVISAYYFIDDISVVQIDEESECECEIDSQFEEVNIVYEVAPINTEGLNASQILQFSNVYFGVDKHILTESDYQHLDIVVDAVKDGSNKIMLTGHCDSEEAEKDPGIGLERAEEVKDYLVSQGIDGNRIMVENKKNDMPADASGTDIGNAKNRRVSFTLIK